MSRRLHSPAMTGTRPIIIGLLLLLLCLPGWRSAPAAFLAVWLASWLFVLAIVMGSLAIAWLHTLTGGRWGEAIGRHGARVEVLLPWLSLLFVPVLAGLSDLYPWAAADARWQAEVAALSAPAFKTAWLMPAFFGLRAVLLLAVWNALAWLTPRFGRRRGFAAFALIAYGFTAGIAGFDWVMSLAPTWYSSVFGLLFALGQLLAGMAFSTLLVCRAAGAMDEAGDADGAATRRDLGNLLLSFVMCWAYLAFSQFLIIWSENLPHEIAWYIARRDGVWFALGIAVVLLQFVLPQLLLLFRAVKESALRLQWVAGGVLLAAFFNALWLTLPSLAAHFQGGSASWLLPACPAGMLLLCLGLLRRQGGRHA